ncbi:MAG: Hpt domain-containing protein [Clostridia bacterium]|nr:Hpt domain-containing protein [Clostridia bacterium]
MTVKEFYDSIGVSPDEVIKRFGGSETMLTKFLNKFLADTTFNQLEEAVAAGDNETTFRAAHTLKGLAGNFDFVKLRDLSASIVERYRANDFAPIPEIFGQLKVCYNETVESLKKLFA